MGQANFTAGIENVTFTPDQIYAINQQAANDLQQFQPPEILQPEPGPVISGVDPNWDPDFLRQITTELGTAYNGYVPTTADVNNSLRGTVYYQETIIELLAGKYWPLVDLEWNRADNSYFVFSYNGYPYYTLTENRSLFLRAGYTFMVANDYKTYAIEPGQQPYETWPLVNFAAPDNTDIVNTQPIYMPNRPNGALLGDNEPNHTNYLDTPVSNLPPEPEPEVAPPLQNDDDPSNSNANNTTANVIVIGVVVIGLAMVFRALRSKSR